MKLIHDQKKTKQIPLQWNKTEDWTDKFASKCTWLEQRLIGNKVNTSETVNIRAEIISPI